MKFFGRLVSAVAVTAALAGGLMGCGGDSGTNPGGGTTPGSGTSGGGSGGNGTLTITDIPSKYNGKYAMVSGTGKSLAEQKLGLIGVQSYTGNQATYSRISNGRVSVSTWLLNTDDGTYVRYSGSDTVGLLVVAIYKVSTATEVKEDQSNLLASGVFTTLSIPFSNGSATISGNDANAWTEYK